VNDDVHDAAWILVHRAQDTGVDDLVQLYAAAELFVAVVRRYDPQLVQLH